MTAVPVFYTTLIVCLNVIATGGGSNMFLPEEFATFTEEDIQERIKGSKIVIISEQVRWLASDKSHSSHTVFDFKSAASGRTTSYV